MRSICYLNLILFAVTVSCGGNKELAVNSEVTGHNAPIVWLDQPRQTVDISKASTKNIPFSGWAVSAEGIKSIGLYVDGEYTMDGTAGLERPDLKAAYPNISQAASSGWWINFPPNDLNVGSHKISIKIQSNNGRVSELTGAINVKP